MKMRVFGIIFRLAIMAAAVSVILLLSVKAYQFGKAVFDEREGTAENPLTATIEITEDESVSQVAAELEEAGIIDSSCVFIVQKYFYGSKLKVGSYLVNSNMTGKGILDVLSGAAVNTEEAA